MPSHSLERVKEFIQRRFNHDLAVEEADRAHLREKWPVAGPLLICEELIEAFGPYERSAKRYKLFVQWTGSLAVALSLVALAGAATELWKPGVFQPTLPLSGGVISTSFEVAGLAGLAFALLTSRLRGTWLKCRFVTEVMRQWHFRRLLSLQEWHQDEELQIEAYNENRRVSFSALVEELRGTAGQKMARLIEDNYDILGNVPMPVLTKHADLRSELLAAYRTLRIDHQLDYAVHKLGDEDNTFAGLSNKVLVAATDKLAGFTLFAAVVFSCVSLVIPLAWSVFAAVALSILGVSVRAWRDGLALREERERYRRMKDQLNVMRIRWDTASDDDTRFALAFEVESVALQELRAFLSEHQKAQFIF